MAMETCSLLDDGKQSSMRTDLSLYEMYKTRLVRVDLGSRSRTDPFQRRLHKCLRALRYWQLSRKSRNKSEPWELFTRGHKWSYQNTVLVANVAGRLVIAAITTAFLVVPLAILSFQLQKHVQLVVVSVCIVIFSFLVSTMLKVSNLEMMVVSAAYAAVLSVFVSNV